MSATFLIAAATRAVDAVESTPQRTKEASAHPAQKLVVQPATKPAAEQAMKISVPATSAIPSDNLKAMLSVARDAVGVALVLHPNPLRRGTLNSQPVPAICADLQQRQWSTLRFNMRKAEDALEQLEANLADANAALDALLQATGASATGASTATVAVIGYSWGSLVGHLLPTSYLLPLTGWLPLLTSPFRI